MTYRLRKVIRIVADTMLWFVKHNELQIVPVFPDIFEIKQWLHVWSETTTFNSLMWPPSEETDVDDRVRLQCNVWCLTLALRQLGYLRVICGYLRQLAFAAVASGPSCSPSNHRGTHVPVGNLVVLGSLATFHFPRIQGWVTILIPSFTIAYIFKWNHFFYKWSQNVMLLYIGHILYVNVKSTYERKSDWKLFKKGKC